MLKTHEHYILRCLELAQNGLFAALPNPSVGAVLVCNDRIIGEGYTAAYGGAHAEVNAIAAVKHRELIPQSTLYVSLEPCSHFGKTPPCSDLIIRSGIRQVVVGTLDPFALVCGQGIAKMKAAGIEVIIGVLEQACQESNKRFFCFHQNKRPYVILKWAESLDGYIAPLDKDELKPVWITNSHSRQLVHQWRAEEMGILVGTQTAKVDNPRLDTRDWYGPNPVRIYLDRQNTIPEHYHLLDQRVKTICITADASQKNRENLFFETADFTSNLAQQICEILYKHQIASVIVEGGSKTLAGFIDAKLWDEARIFTGAHPLHSGTKAPEIRGTTASKSSVLEDYLHILKP